MRSGAVSTRGRRWNGRAVVWCACAIAVLALAVVSAGEGAVSGTGEDVRRRERDAEAAVVDALPSDERTLSELFAWSIEHSDPERLREMAAAAAGGGRGGEVGDSGAGDGRSRERRARGGSTRDALDDGSGSIGVEPERKPLTMEEIERKRADVREALDAMNAGPSVHDFARECGAIAANAGKNETKERRIAALEILYDLVAPVDIANDLEKLGVADSLIIALGDEDEDVASAAASALASAASNNVIVQGIIYERGGLDVLLKLVSSSLTPSETRHKALWVLGMCVRTHEPSRLKFFAADGARVFTDVLSPNTPMKTRTRGIALLGDLLQTDGVAEVVFADEGVAKRLIGDVVSVATDAPADVVEKSLQCIRAARERGPKVARDAIEAHASDLSTIADRFAREDGNEFAADVARLARALASAPRDEL